MKSNLKDILWRVSPRLYDQLIIWLSSDPVRAIRGFQNRRRLQAIIHSGQPFCVDICSRKGFGALLTDTVIAHHLFCLHPNFCGVISTNPLYKLNQQCPDVLGQYLERRQPYSQKNCLTVPFRFPADISVRPLTNGLTLDDARRYFHTNYTVKAHLLAEIDELFSSYQSRMVGVHYRGSDKRLEAAPINYSTVAALVERGMEIAGCEDIFVATDEEPFLTYMRHRYGSSRVRALNCRYLSNGITGAHYMDGDGYEKGREALLTILALSRCELCVRGQSYLSAWASIFNPELPIIMFGKRKSLPFPEQEIADHSLPVTV